LDTVIVSDISIATDPGSLSQGHPLCMAADSLREGGLVAFPTETVYGLGANALDPEAVKSIFRVKGRPSDNPLIVHVPETSHIRRLVKEIPGYAEAMIEDLMPGPVTLVFTKSELIPYEVTSGLETVAVRVPSHPIARLFLTLSGVPVAAPSANISGSPSPTNVSHVINDLSGKIPYIIDGGPSDVGLESTVIDVTGDHPVILRPGGVSEEDIIKYHPKVEYSSETTDTPKSPGMKYRHYAPAAKVISVGPFDTFDDMVSVIADRISDPDNGEIKIGVYSNDKVIEALREQRIVFEPISYGNTTDVKAAAYGLFAAFRRADEKGLQILIVEAFREEGIGKAYMNRLNKAASSVESRSDKNIVRRLVFVCTGNTCRSPMAEYLIRAETPEACVPGFVVSSAGIGTMNGMRASESALNVMNELFGIDMSAHRSSVFTDNIAESNDLILAMTAWHRDVLRKTYPSAGHKIHTLYGFVRGEDRDINDPYGQGEDSYRETALEIKSLTDELLVRSNVTE